MAAKTDVAPRTDMAAKTNMAPRTDVAPKTDMAPKTDPAWLVPITLSGEHARLVPLQAAHCEDLKQAARDGELWKLWYTSVPQPEGMAKEIERRLHLQSQGTMLPW